MSPDKQERDPGREALENEFRAMFAERSETVRVKTAPYAAVRQRIVSARRRRRMRIGSAGVAFAVAVVGVGVWSTVPARHHGAVAPTSTVTKTGVPAKVLYADGRTEIPAGPLRNAALGWLGTNYGKDLTGLTVVTTFDQAVQAAASAKASAADTGVAVVDARSGDVLALGGTWDRQIEIADLMKPIALAAAFETGHYTPESTEPLDSKNHPLYWPPGSKQPMTYYATDKGRAYFWPPESPGTTIHDLDVTLTQAAESGANEPFAQLELAPDIAITKISDVATSLGMPQHAPDFNRVPSLVLGTAEASPLTMATIYATFADGGVRHDPRMVGQLLGKDGRPLWTPKDTAAPVIAPNVAQDVAEVLHASMQGGPTSKGLGSLADSGSGTGAMAAAADMEHSAWVDGIDSHYAIAVGLSNMDAGGTVHPVEAHPVGGGLAVGSRLAGPTWAAVVKAVRQHG